MVVPRPTEKLRGRPTVNSESGRSGRGDQSTLGDQENVFLAQSALLDSETVGGCSGAVGETCSFEGSDPAMIC